MPKEKMKYLLWYSLALLLILTACDLDLTDEGEVNIPEYQEAIYIMDADGSNKTKVIDVDGCENVQFIPNSNKLLYLADNSLYTVNTDGTENVKISGELNVRKDYPAISEQGDKIVFAVYSDERDYIYDLYMTDVSGNNLENITNTSDKSEKEASFIQYNGQECLLYVSYFRENDKNYCSINTYDFNGNDQICILKEVGNNDFATGFSDPCYNPVDENLFVFWGNVSGVIYQYSSLINGVVLNEYTAKGDIYYYSHTINDNLNQIVYCSRDQTLLLLNYKTDQYTNFGQGFNYKIEANFCYYSIEKKTFSDIYSIDLISFEKYLLADNAKMPYPSQENTLVCYLAQYITNPKSKNYLTD